MNDLCCETCAMKDTGSGAWNMLLKTGRAVAGGVVRDVTKQTLAEISNNFYRKNLTIPIDVGGRLTGKVGKYGVGVMNIQTGDEDVSATTPTNFSVIRVKRDILRRSSLGLIFTGRSVGTTGVGASEAYGVDSSFSFGPDLAITAWAAQSRNNGVTKDGVRIFTASPAGLHQPHLTPG